MESSSLLDALRNIHSLLNEAMDEILPDEDDLTEDANGEIWANLDAAAESVYWAMEILTS